MKTQKHDRRSLRTRRLIGDAFVSLLLERPFVDVTVQDILDRANIGRSTFYAHYWDKQDLLSSEIERMIDVLSQRVEEELATGVAVTRRLPIPARLLFEHVEAHYRLYRALAHGSGLELVLTAFRTRLSQRVEDYLRASAVAPLTDTSVQVTAQAVAGMFLSLLQWWLDTGMTLTPKEMDEYFWHLALPGIEAMLLTGACGNDHQMPVS